MVLSNSSFLLLSIFIFPFTSTANPSEDSTKNLTTQAAAVSYNDNFSTTITDWNCPYWVDYWIDQPFEQHTHCNEYSSADSTLRPSDLTEGCTETSQSRNIEKPDDFSSYNQIEQHTLPQYFVDKNNHDVVQFPAQQQSSTLTAKVTSKTSIKTPAEKAQNKILSDRKSQARLRQYQQKIREAYELNDQLMNNASQTFLRGGNPEVILRQLLTEYKPTPERKLRTQMPKSVVNSTNEQHFDQGNNQDVSLVNEPVFDVVQMYEQTSNLHY